MRYTIRKSANSTGLEHHESASLAQRALHVLNAHEMLNGRKPGYWYIDPPVPHAEILTWDQCDLPYWALRAYE